MQAQVNAPVKYIGKKLIGGLASPAKLRCFMKMMP